MQWAPLQLDMLPSIAIQTSKVIEFYKNTCREVQGGSSYLASKLKELKNQMAHRVQQLDDFYVRFHFDERIHLFHRLKLQLKKAISRKVEEIDNSYLQPESLGVSIVREQLALIDSALGKDYEDNIPDYREAVNASKPQSSKILVETKSKGSIKQVKSSKKVSKLNLNKLPTHPRIKTSKESKQSIPTQSKAQSQVESQVQSQTQTRRNPPPIPSTTPYHPLAKSSESPSVSPSRPKLEQIVFTIKMTKEEYLQFLQAKKNT